MSLVENPPNGESAHRTDHVFNFNLIVIGFVVHLHGLFQGSRHTRFSRFMAEIC